MITITPTRCESTLPTMNLGALTGEVPTSTVLMDWMRASETRTITGTVALSATSPEVPERAVSLALVPLNELAEDMLDAGLIYMTKDPEGTPVQGTTLSWDDADDLDGSLLAVTINNSLESSGITDEGEVHLFIEVSWDRSEGAVAEGGTFGYAAYGTLQLGGSPETSQAVMEPGLDCALIEAFVLSSGTQADYSLMLNL